MKCKYLIPLTSMGFAAFLLGPSPALAQVTLGDAAAFGVLAGTAVTCTNSTVTGDVGVAAGTVTRTSCTVNGTVHQGDPAAVEAYADFLRAYDDLRDEPCTGTLNTAYGVETVTLRPGVYCNAAAVTFTGTTLRLNGPANGIWIFKIGTGGTGALTATNLSVEMVGGGQPCNVFWWISQAVTQTTSNFQGTILAGADITVTGTVSNGAALAGGAGTPTVPTGAVTLTGSIVSVCGAGGGCKVRVILDCDDDDDDGDHDDDDGDHDDDDDDDDDDDHRDCKKHGKKGDKKHDKKDDRKGNKKR